MFKNFCDEFQVGMIKKEKIVMDDKLNRIFSNSSGAVEFLKNFAGKTFIEGLYRIHKVDEISKWNTIVSDVFPELEDLIVCFAYDWLGRQIALDFRRKQNDEPLIIMLEPGTGEALEIPATFMTFHEEELVEYKDAALAVDFFNQWREKNKEVLSPNQCVGYRVPLFVGGQDSIENLELSDIEVYWNICGQLLNKVRDLPPGTPINITIS